MNFAVVRHQKVIELGFRLSHEAPLHALQCCITLRDPLVVLIPSPGFESKLSVTVVMYLWA